MVTALVGWLAFGFGPYPLLAVLAVEAVVGYRMRHHVRGFHRGGEWPVG